MSASAMRATICSSASRSAVSDGATGCCVVDMLPPLPPDALVRTHVPMLEGPTDIRQPRAATVDNCLPSAREARACHAAVPAMLTVAGVGPRPDRGRGEPAATAHGCGETEAGESTRGARRGYSAAPLEDRCLARSEEHTSELQSRGHLVCRLLHEI